MTSKLFILTCIMTRLNDVLVIKYLTVIFDGIKFNKDTDDCIIKYVSLICKCRTLIFTIS